MTRRDVATMLALVAATYPTVELAEATVEAWYGLLRDLDATIAMTALQRVLSTQEIPALPTPGRIRQEAAKLAHPASLSPEEAWAKVIEAVRRHGFYEPPGGTWDFDDPCLASAVRAIGWDRLCTTEEPGVERAHFLRIYHAFLERADEELLLPPSLRRGSIGGQGESTIGEILRPMLGLKRPL